MEAIERDEINDIIDNFSLELKRKCSTDQFCNKSVKNLLSDLMSNFDYKTQNSEKALSVKDIDIRGKEEIAAYLANREIEIIDDDDKITLPPGL